MPNPPPLPDPARPRFQNGNHPNPAPAIRAATSTPEQSRGVRTFLAPFLGAFAAVILIGVVGAIVYFAIHALHSSSASAPGGKPKDLLMDVAAWGPGKDVAKTLDDSDKPDIGWWTRTFDLPKQDAVVDYLKKQGLTVSRIEPAHFSSTADDTTVTYHVYAEVPQQLMHLQKAAWRPDDPDMRRFTQVLVLNDGLPPGQVWNTQNLAVAAEAGTKLDFAWKVHWDKTYGLVDTDKLPLSEGVFTQEQVNQYATDQANTVTQLHAQLQQIDAQVQQDVQAKLAQVPADPARPELLSSKWGGDGSGEPTKSAERIGGGTLAGAAGGAAFGAAAGDAGMGAGIGAGVGLLGGLIYDGVSKSNDRKRHERAVAAENEERLDNWRAQVRDLKKQRTQIQADGVAEKNQLLADLANRIAANKGHLEAIVAAPGSTTEQPPVSDAPPVEPVPTADQPSGPILVASAAAASPTLAGGMAKSVQIVDNSNASNDRPQGNIEVTYAGGQTAKLTQDGRSRDPHVSKRGDAGWVSAIGTDPKYERQKDILSVRMHDGSMKTFQPNALFIDSWGFADNSTAIVIASMHHHGPESYIKYDLETGKVLGHVDDYVPHDDLPEWAQPYDKN